MARHKPLKSSATNAYDLLKDVCKVILEEPSRYIQELFVLRDEEIRSALDYRFDEARVYCGISARARKPEPPPCGTMACRAGWIVALHDGHMPRYAAEIERRAYQILDAGHGATQRYLDEVSELFSGGAVRRNDIGTAAYARDGVNGLRKFMAKHKARLKAITFPKR